MNKRDEIAKEKFINIRGHNKGKSLNVVNLNSMSNIMESSKQQDIPMYTKSKNF